MKRELHPYWKDDEKGRKEPRLPCDFCTLDFENVGDLIAHIAFDHLCVQEEPVTGRGTFIGECKCGVDWTAGRVWRNNTLDHYLFHIFGDTWRSQTQTLEGVIAHYHDVLNGVACAAKEG